MIELPQEVRDLLMEQLDEYIEEVVNSPDAEELAQVVVEKLPELAEELELEFDKGDDIIGYLEIAGDLEAPFQDMLMEQLEMLDQDNITAEDVLVTMERLCEIDWMREDDEIYDMGRKFDMNLAFDPDEISDDDY